jgi:uncharacterized membrane protein
MATETSGRTEARSEKVAALRERKAARNHLHPVNQIHVDEATFGERLADQVANGIGSWRFLIIQTSLIALWVVLNLVAVVRHWDPYPFILLNLCFSLQAAYTGPVLLVANNRQAQLDRLRLEHTAEAEEAAEKVTIEILHEIERNTEATLKILERVKQRRAEVR